MYENVKIGNLSKDEEFDLIKRAKKGDEVSKNKLIMAHLNHANKSIRYFVERNKRKNSEEIVEDVSSAIYDAMDKCIKSFDFARGARFATALNWYLRSELTSYFSLNNAEKRGGGQKKISFDMAIDDEGTTLKSIVPDENSLDLEDNIIHKIDMEKYKDKLYSVMENLDDREKSIIIGSFFYDQKLREMSNVHNITRQRVQQIREIALSKLRKAMEINVTI